MFYWVLFKHYIITPLQLTALVFLLNKIVRSIPLKFAVSLLTSLVAFYVTIKGSEWKHSMRRTLFNHTSLTLNFNYYLVL